MQKKGLISQFGDNNKSIQSFESPSALQRGDITTDKGNDRVSASAMTKSERNMGQKGQFTLKSMKVLENKKKDMGRNSPFTRAGGAIAEYKSGSANAKRNDTEPDIHKEVKSVSPFGTKSNQNGHESTEMNTVTKGKNFATIQNTPGATEAIDTYNHTTIQRNPAKDKNILIQDNNSTSK